MGTSGTERQSAREPSRCGARGATGSSHRRSAEGMPTAASCLGVFRWWPKRWYLSFQMYTTCTRLLLRCMYVLHLNGQFGMHAEFLHPSSVSIRMVTASSTELKEAVDARRGAWSAPLPTAVLPVASVGPELEAAGVGVAVALCELIKGMREPASPCTLRTAGHLLCPRLSTPTATTLGTQGWLPTLFNERLTPLSGIGAPIPGFCFTEPHHDLEAPPEGVITTFVLAIVSRLGLQVEELIMAYAFVERALMENPTLMRSYSVRPMFVGGCVLAMKLARDDELKLRELHERLDDVLNVLSIYALVRAYAPWPLPTAPAHAPASPQATTETLPRPPSSHGGSRGWCVPSAQVNIEHQMLECMHWRFP